MTIVVSIMRPKAIGPDGFPVVGYARIREDLTAGSTTTGTLNNGEVFYLVSTETAAIAVATGTAPDAATTTGTAASTAGIPVAPNIPVTIAAPAGSKLNAKALS